MSLTVLHFFRHHRQYPPMHRTGTLCRAPPFPNEYHLTMDTFTHSHETDVSNKEHT